MSIRGPALSAAALLLVVIPAARAAGETATLSSAGPGVQWVSGTFEQALKRAVQQKKLVLFDAWAHWCAPCRVMERDVWSREDLARALDREAVPVRVEVDRPHGVNVALGDKYGIQALPQVLFIDPATGEAVERLLGVQTPEAILETLDRARAKVGSAEQVLAAGDDSTALVSLAGRLQRAGKTREARSAAEKAFALDRDCARNDADDAALLIADLDVGANDKPDAARILEQAALRCPAASGTVEIWRRLVDLAPDVGGVKERDRLLRLQSQRRPDDAGSQQALALFLAGQGGDLKTAEEAAARAMRLAPDDPQSLAAMAEVRLAQKNFDEASALVDRAITIDPHDPALRELRFKVKRAQLP